MRVSSSARTTTRPAANHENLAQGLHQWARVVGAQQSRAAYLPLAQDAGLQQPSDLAAGGRVRQAGLLGQIGDTEFVAGEQQRREQARLAVRPEDRS